MDGQTNNQMPFPHNISDYALKGTLLSSKHQIKDSKNAVMFNVIKAISEQLEFLVFY
jgi:hypothetical protein